MGMNRFIGLFMALCLVFFMAQDSQAEEYRVLVLPDNIDFSSTNYLIYPDSSVVFASDTINEIKKDGRVTTVSMTEVRDALRKNTKLALLTKKALKEYKYNYNVPFVDFKAIANNFNTNKILVITSQTDVQNYFLQRTLWDFLNIPGATVINPGYKLSTYAVLIDVDKEEVIWQSTYYKTISSMENRMVAMSFAPATEQLSKIKSYSLSFLSPEISRMVQTRILPPPLLPNQNGNGIVEVSNKNTDATIITPLQDEPDLKLKTITPLRTKSNGYGAVINDL